MDFEQQHRDEERKSSLPEEQKTFDPWEEHFRREYHPADKEFEY